MNSKKGRDVIIYFIVAQNLSESELNGEAELEN